MKQKINPAVLYLIILNIIFYILLSVNLVTDSF